MASVTYRASCDSCQGLSKTSSSSAGSTAGGRCLRGCGQQSRQQQPARAFTSQCTLSSGRWQW
jgi:hypothetical protein